MIVRFINLIGCLVSVFVLTAAFYIEYRFGIQPCPLCILQRFTIFFLAILFLLSFWQNPARLGTKLYGFGIAVFASIGLFLASRQVWLQMHPVSLHAICVPGFSYMLAHLPLGETLRSMLEGSENCAQVNWRLLGMSLAGWSLCFFAVVEVWGIYQIIRKKPHRRE